MGTAKRRAKGEGTIYFSEAKARWVAKAIVGLKPTGAPRYRQITARTQDEARRKKARAEHEAGGGMSGDAGRVTVGQYFDHWLNDVRKHSVERSTWHSYERCVRLHVKPRLGGVRLADLRPAHVTRLYSDLLAAGRSAGNTAKVGEVVGTALEHAVRSGTLPHNPAASVPKPKPKAKTVTPFTPAEVRRILAAARGHRLEALFVLAFATGMRQGELLGLGWEHVGRRGFVRVERSLAQTKGTPYLKPPKSALGTRNVALPAFAVEALDRHAERATAAERGYVVVFATGTGGFFSKSSFLRSNWGPLLEKAGVAYRNFHQIRHTHVSQLLAAGEAVPNVARRVGDQPAVMLKVYAHFIHDSDAEIGAKLQSLYVPGCPPESAGQGGDKEENVRQ